MKDPWNSLVSLCNYDYICETKFLVDKRPGREFDNSRSSGRDFRLPPRNRRELRPSGLLRSEWC
jgi:hypothetical protein